MTNLLLRPAKTSDVAFIKSLIGQYAPDRRMLKKEIMTLFEDIQEFVIAELNGEPVGYGALHVLWEDLAEVRSVAVRPEMKRHGIGRAVVEHFNRTCRKVGD